MSEVWFRGQSSTVAPSSPGTDLHDFGDGVYFTDSLDVARRYAALRVSEGGGTPQVFSVSVERSQLGSVLDLTKDQRWSTFMARRASPSSPTFEQIIRTVGNENYGRFFDAFVSENRIQLRDFDAVIGPEMVRGGTQMCLLNRGGRMTPSAVQLRQQMRLVPRGANGLSISIPSVEAPISLQPNSRLRRVAGNQAAVAGLGMMIYGALQELGEAALRKRTQDDVDGRLANPIAALLNRGRGVLVIASISESDWITPMGDRMRSYLTTNIQGGPSPEEALTLWREQPRWLQGAPVGCHVAENYVWIPAAQR